jgi:hypothetical protein
VRVEVGKDRERDHVLPARATDPVKAVENPKGEVFFLRTLDLEVQVKRLAASVAHGDPDEDVHAAAPFGCLDQEFAQFLVTKLRWLRPVNGRADRREVAGEDLGKPAVQEVFPCPIVIGCHARESNRMIRAGEAQTGLARVKV